MNKKLTFTAIITILILFFGFFSYVYISDVDALGKVKVTIKRIGVEEIGLSSTTLKLTIDLSNPSDRDVSNLNANFKIYIAGNYIGDGVSSKVNVPAKSSKEKDVQIVIYYSNVATAVIDALTSLDFELSIDGKAESSILFGIITISQDFQASRTYP
jgi:LEA14-like dessication related protein